MPVVFHFSNNSIAGIFLAMLLLFVFAFLYRVPGGRVYILLLIAVSVLASMLVLSNSRAGWLGFATGLCYIIWLHLQQKWRKVFLVSAITFLVLFLLLLFFYKAGSSSGRKHIYQLSATMLRDNWLYGIGLNKFRARFNEYQADYFSVHDIDSQRAFLADNTFYAFNDYLQWVIEAGLAGLIILLVAAYLIIRRISLFHRNGAPAPVIIIAATTSLLCVAVAALFSYPLQVVPIQAFVLSCLSIVLFYPLPCDDCSVQQKAIQFFQVVMMVVLLLLFVYKVANQDNRMRMEKEPFELARSGYKTAAIIKYQQLTEKYPDAGNNWFLYARQLYYLNQLPEAKQALANGMAQYVDNKMYKLKGDIEFELGIYEMAEQSYLRAIHMVPNRMGNRLDLLNFYLARSDTVKADYWARSILNMRIKIPSDKVEKILLQVRRIYKGLKSEVVSGSGD